MKTYTLNGQTVTGFELRDILIENGIKARVTANGVVYGKINYTTEGYTSNDDSRFLSTPIKLENGAASQPWR